MKIRYCIFVIILFYSLHANGNQSRIDSLINSYHNLNRESNNIEYISQYFNYFPDSFKEFNNIFGYIDIFSPCCDIIFGPLYEEHFDYIKQYFGIITFIEDSIYLNKTINICIGGEWDADAISIFQYQIQQMILCDTIKDIDPICFVNSNTCYREKLLFYLAIRSRKEILSFWHFYLDNAESVDENLYKQTLKMLHGYNKLKRLLKKEYYFYKYKYPKHIVK